MARLAFLCLVVSLGLGALVITSSLNQSGEDVIALVNGESITRADFVDYEMDVVGEAREGEARSVALLSLINQALVKQTALRLDITVPEAVVQAQVDAALSNPTISNSLRTDADMATFRRRTRMWLLSEAVRDEVVTTPTISDAEVERQFMAEAGNTGLSLHDAEAAIRERLSAKATSELWVRWLGQKRACASLVILDPQLSLPQTATYECQ